MLAAMLQKHQHAHPSARRHPKRGPGAGLGPARSVQLAGSRQKHSEAPLQILVFFFFFFFSSQIQNKLLIAVLALTLAALPASACAPLSADLRRRLLLFIYS